MHEKPETHIYSLAPRCDGTEVIGTNRNTEINKSFIPGKDFLYRLALYVPSSLNVLHQHGKSWRSDIHLSACCAYPAVSQQLWYIPLLRLA